MEEGILHAAEFRRCLVQMDVAGMMKLWAHVAPHLGNQSPKDALISMHMARCEMKRISPGLRKYSQEWLFERGYPGVNSVTIGGVQATIHSNVANGGWYVGVIIASAIVPFGSTADVVIDFPGYWLGGWYQGHVQIYRATGLAAAPLDTVSSNTGTYTNVHTLTDIETVPNGVIVAGMTANNQSSMVVTYNGVDSVAQDVNVLDYARYTAMSVRTTEAALTNDLTFAFSGNGEGVAAVVSFAPA